MCGRYTVSNPDDILAELASGGDGSTLAARYNVAPRQIAPVVVAGEDGSRQVVSMRWGLIPNWTKDPDNSLPVINARAETVAEKALFRESLRRRRCVVAADGFYEWQRLARGKQPFLLRLEGGAPFGFAGLWDRCRSAAGEVLETFTILTTVANELVEPIHNRMPVILGRQDREDWLACGAEQQGLRRVCEPCEASSMEVIPVSRYVNNISHDSLECLRPIRLQCEATLF